MAETNRLIPNAKQDNKVSGRFKRLLVMIKLILRVFRVPRRHAASDVLRSPLSTQLSPSHGLHISRRPPNLHQLALEDGRQKVNERIQWRLQGHRSSVDDASTSPCRTDPPMELSGDVKRILCNSPWNRTIQDIELARKELLKCSAFKDYPSSIQKTLCKVSWYQFVEDGRVIIKKGHCTSAFHIILAGKVTESSEEIDGRGDTILRAGDTFGGAELLNDGKRTTTCTATEFAELLVVSKSDYLDLGLRQARKSYQKSKHYEFCKTINVLKHWPLSELDSQPDVCKLLYSRPNEVVVKDSQKADRVYVVLSGSCRVVKRYVDTNMTSKRYQTHPAEIPQNKLSIHRKSLGQLLAREHALRSDSPILGERFTPQRAKGMKHSYTTGSLQAMERGGGQLHPPPPPLIPATRKHFLVQLQILQPKDIFGLSAIIHESEPSVTLVSNGAELVVISKAFILQHLTESMKTKLKRQVMQYPSEEAMRKRIRDHYNWKIYKQTMTNQPKRRI